MPSGKALDLDIKTIDFSKITGIQAAQLANKLTSTKATHLEAEQLKAQIAAHLRAVEILTEELDSRS